MIMYCKLCMSTCERERERERERETSLLKSNLLSTVIPYCKLLRWLLSSILSSVLRFFFVRCSSIQVSTRHTENFLEREREKRRGEGREREREIHVLIRFVYIYIDTVHCTTVQIHVPVLMHMYTCSVPLTLYWASPRLGSQ